MATALARACGSPRNSSGSMTFSSALRWVSSWKDWNTKPSLSMRRRARPSSSSAKMSTPSSSTVPVEGLSRPASKPSRVDLPDPDAPTMASVSARCTVKSTLCRMVSSPLLSATRFANCLTSIAASCVWPRSLTFETSGMSRMLAVLTRYMFGLTLLLAAAVAHSAPKTVLVLGDSLSAEYGLARGAGWVALMENRLKNEHVDAAIVNASISGETTSGGRVRLPALLAQYHPALLLIGMRMPPNYGRAYTDSFFAMYARVAKESKTALVPFMLEGVAQTPELFQADRLHPVAQAHPIILTNIYPALLPLLKGR